MVVVVEIEDRTSPKPFLGGWRNVARDLEYHDAASQTRAADVAPARHLVSVRVQTRSIRRANRSTHAPGVERAVQAGPYFPEITDCLVQPRNPWELRRCKAAGTIQRCYRAYRSRRLGEAAKEPDDKSYCLLGRLDSPLEDDRSNDLIDDRLASPVESTDCQRHASPDIGDNFHILEPSSGPRGRSDLSVLRNLLDRWSAAEESRIRESLQDGPRQSAQVDRLRRELEVLRAIERSKNELARRKAERVRADFLDVLARPIRLEGRREAPAWSLETLNVQRAREFRDLYEALLTPDDHELTDREARAELLYAVRRLAGQHTCPAASSLEYLIDQELYLLATGAQPARLGHLRSRMRLAFLNLARRALLRHDARAKCKTRTRLCPSCNRLRGVEAFETDHRERMSRTCADCAALKARSREPELCLEIYERMLRELRRDEAARRDGSSSLAFAMGPKAIRYLVNDIWHGRSVFSDSDELERLRLARLEPSAPWAPWNNLLATRREARMHEILALDAAGLPAVYDEELCRKLRRMNLQARLYFESMARHADTGISL